MHRRVSLLLDTDVITDVDVRCRFTSRSRNRELTFLLKQGLMFAMRTGREAKSGDHSKFRTCIYPDEALVEQVEERIKTTSRSLGREINILIRLALVAISERDAEIIRQKVTGDPAAPAHSQTEEDASQPAT